MPAEQEMDPGFRRDDGAHVTIIPFKARALDGTPHGFLGREGGVSTGTLAGLNVGLGSADDRTAIAENRQIGRAHV